MKKFARKISRSLKLRMILPVVLIMAVVISALVWCTSRAYTQTIIAQEDAKVQTSFTVIGSAVREMIDTSTQAVVNTLLDERIKTYLAADFANDKTRILARLDCLEAMNTVLAQQPGLYGMLFIREDGSAFGCLPRQNYFVDDRDAGLLDDATWAHITESGRRGVGWYGPFGPEAVYTVQFGRDADLPDSVMLGVNRAKDIAYGTVYAIAVLDTGAFEGYLELLTDSGSGIYLLDGQGCVIAQAGTQKPPSEGTRSCLEGGGSQGAERVKVPSQSEEFYLSYRRLPTTGWYLLRELPMNRYNQTLQTLQKTVWLIAAVMLIAAIAFYLYWLRSFMRTFRSLEEGIVRLRNGQLGAKLETPFSIDEFETIREEFNEMSCTIQGLVETTKEMEHQKLELQMKNLQTQLSPHMIFNSLTAMRWMATMVGQDQLSDMLLELSEMLRPVFRDWKNEWTLGEELGHLQHYVRLLHLRYGSHFSIDCDVPDELSDCFIPRFTLQPLVENACEHGGNDDIHVCICAWRTEDRLNIMVSDNGAGIPEEKLKKIREGIRSGEMDGRIGLVNVHSRLCMLCGEDSAMDVESSPERGTTIAIHVKMRREKRDEHHEEGAESYNYHTNH